MRDNAVVVRLPSRVRSQTGAELVEFAMVLPDTGADGALAVAGRVRERIAAHRFLAAEGYDIRLTVSTGVATLPDIPGSPHDLLVAADRAMYRVKASGKNGIQVATAPPQ